MKLVLKRSRGAGLNGDDYLVVESDEGFQFVDCYVPTGTEVTFGIEEGSIVVIRQASDGALLAEAHPPNK